MALDLNLKGIKPFSVSNIL